MSSQSLLGLPPISAALKPIIPFLQRATELRVKDPIIAYWCAYHAAQLGISLKAKDTASRDVLFALLGFLERLKKEIGPADALDIESVSSAYVENFAFKVFATADNEDRTGSTTRSTAKKFLAAAHFLEVLKVFPKAEVSESVEEKMKYAKWKAADIAKAFREGRIPTPGSAFQATNDSKFTPPATPAPLTANTSHELSEVLDDADVDLAPSSQTPPRFAGSHLDIRSYGAGGLGVGEATPGSWSTAATPGAERPPSDDWEEQTSPSREETRGDDPGDSILVQVPQEGALVNDSIESQDKDEDNLIGRQTPTNDDAFRPSARFSPVAGYDSSASSLAYDGQIPPPPKEAEWPTIEVSSRQTAPSESGPFVDTAIHAALPPGFVLNPFRGTASSSHITHEAPDDLGNLKAQQSELSVHHMHTPSAPPLPPFELTPSIVAKAQKHCRFAISSLDYEDAEQARKELRAALAILGG